MSALCQCDETGDNPKCLSHGAGSMWEIRQERNHLLVERDAWIETARLHSKNEEFYRGLVRDIGEQFGKSAYTSDDGSVQQDVLCLKVPALVRQARVALAAALDVLPRWTETEVVPNNFGTQRRCVYCKGHNAGERGVNHAPDCIVGRAIRLCRQSLG